MAVSNLKLLSSETVRLIGSSQVITSVFSVVKELVENSLDAGSTAIDVKLEDFGLEKVEVRDNGCGISRSNLDLVAKRYHTSKISSFNDLDKLSTYGFRGEALGSLSAVCSLSITSKTLHEDISHTVVYDHQGNVMSTSPSHLGQGTTILACKLFRNLPVRRHFYNTVKKKREELKKVEDLLLAYGAVRPDVRLSLRNNKDVIWQKSVVPDTKVALMGILGKNVFSQLQYRRIVSHEPKTTIEAYLPCPGSDVNVTSRSNSDRGFIAVNGRPVYNKDLDKCVRQFYCHHGNCAGRHPVYVIHIHLPTENLDVNVDPNKTQVMLHQQKDIQTLLQGELEALYGPIKQTHDIEKDNLDFCDSSLNDTSNLLSPDSTFNQLSEKIVEKEVQPRSKMTYCQKDNIKNICSKENEPEVSDSGFKISFYIGNTENNEEGDKNKNHLVTSENKNSQLSKNENCVNTRVDEAMSQIEKGDFSIIDSDIIDLLPSQASDVEDPTLSNANITNANILAINNLTTSESGQTGLEDSMKNNTVISNTTKYDKDMNIDAISNVSESTLDPKLNEVSIDKCLKGDISNLCSELFNDTFDETETKCFTEVKEKECVKQAWEDGVETDVNKNVSVEDWSRGRSERGQDGKLLQPVTILSSRKRGWSPDQEEEEQRVNIPPVKKRPSLDQPSLYEVVSRSPGEKTSVGFVAFSREMRPQVMTSHPDATPAEITDKVRSRWEELPDEDKESYMQMGNQQMQDLRKKMTTNQRRLSQKMDHRLMPVKGTPTIKDQLLSASRKQTPSSKVPVKSVRVPFSLTHLRQVFSDGCKSSQSQSQKTFKLRLIGPLKFYNGWVCCLGNLLFVVNPHRAEEVIVHRELMEGHVIPASKLQDPIRLDNRTVSKGEYLQTLVSLLPKEAKQTYTYIEDKRLTANGIQVRCHMDASSAPVFDVISLASCMPTYGLTDVLEVLGLIHDSTSLKLADCRPLKVKFYLQGEAVRMVRKRPLQRNYDDMVDLLEQLGSEVDSNLKCLHERPILTELACLTDLTHSQPSQS